MNKPMEKSTTVALKVILDDLNGPEIAVLLAEHLADMHATSPTDSVHALDLDSLRQPNITFWTAWDGDNLAGCGALKQLNPTHAEIKSMRTAKAYRQQGVASFILHHLQAEAARLGFTQLSLETGTMDFFMPARCLYEKFEFVACPPFADYKLDPNSAFMTKYLSTS